MSEVEETNPQSASGGEKETSIERNLHALKGREAIELRRWWCRLTLDPGLLKSLKIAPGYPRGLRAVLRRSESLPSVMMTEVFRHLRFTLESRVWAEKQNLSEQEWRRRIETWATIAAIVAELRDETFDVPMAQRLGENRPKTLDTPRMSDLRFQQLLDCHEPVELIRRFRRALKLADGKGVSVVRLADMVALWHREHHGQYRAEATERFAFIMSDGYFKGRSLKTAGTD